MAGISEALDLQVVTQIITDVSRTAASAADTFDSYRSRFCYSKLTDVSPVGKVIFGCLSALAPSRMPPRYSGAQPVIFQQWIACAGISGGVRVSPHIPGPSSHKQDVVIRRGSRPDAVAPIWRNIALIPDELTQASKGEIRITAVVLGAFKTLRVGGFARVQAQFQ